MFGFLKKLFGGDTETNTAAGVQIEQAAVSVVNAKVEAANQAPYKVEAPVAVKAVAPAAKAPAKKKPQATTPKAQKPAAITAPKKSGRKPKSKT